jgi:hypothetical protein
VGLEFDKLGWSEWFMPHQTSAGVDAVSLIQNQNKFSDYYAD